MRPRWLITIAITAALVVFCGATARLFVWPARGMPARVDAIVSLAGPGNRIDAALRLAHEQRARFLVVSRGHDGYGAPCPRPVPRVRLICFEPVPATTQGEAEYVSHLARKYQWRSVVLVTSTAQDTRARQRMKRCFGGRIYVVAVGLPLLTWPGQIAYEWAATLKMLLWQRSC